MYKIIRKI